MAAEEIACSGDESRKRDPDARAAADVPRGNAGGAAAAGNCAGADGSGGEADLPLQERESGGGVDAMDDAAAASVESERSVDDLVVVERHDAAANAGDEGKPLPGSVSSGRVDAVERELVEADVGPAADNEDGLEEIVAESGSDVRSDASYGKAEPFVFVHDAEALKESTDPVQVDPCSDTLDDAATDGKVDYIVSVATEDGEEEHVATEDEGEEEEHVQECSVAPLGADNHCEASAADEPNGCKQPSTIIEQIEAHEKKNNVKPICELSSLVADRELQPFYIVGEKNEEVAVPLTENAYSNSSTAPSDHHIILAATAGKEEHSVISNTSEKLIEESHLASADMDSHFIIEEQEHLDASRNEKRSVVSEDEEEHNEENKALADEESQSTAALNAEEGSYIIIEETKNHIHSGSRDLCLENCDQDNEKAADPFRIEDNGTLMLNVQDESKLESMLTEFLSASHARCSTESSDIDNLATTMVSDVSNLSSTTETDDSVEMEALQQDEGKEYTLDNIVSDSRSSDFVEDLHVVNGKMHGSDDESLDHVEDLGLYNGCTSGIRKLSNSDDVEVVRIENVKPYDVSENSSRASDHFDDLQVENGSTSDVGGRNEGEQEQKCSAEVVSELTDNHDHKTEGETACQMEDNCQLGELHNENVLEDMKSSEEFDSIHVGGVVILPEFINQPMGASREYVSNNSHTTRNSSPEIVETRRALPQNDQMSSDALQSANDLLAINDNDGKQPVVKETNTENGTHGRLQNLVDSNSEFDKVDQQLRRPHRLFIIKVPRFSDDDLWTRIQEAQTQLDEKTQARDQIRIAVQKQKVICEEYRKQLDAAKAEERSVRAHYNAKKQELTGVQLVIKNLDKVNAIDDIKAMIENKERSLQHETMTLKQEKKLIHEIRELKSQHKQLCSDMGNKSEVDEAIEQREQVYEHLENLRKELTSIYINLKSYELKTKEAQKKYENAQDNLWKTKAEFQAADDVRQAAYAFWRDLKNESVKKSEHFFKYRDGQRIASKYASSGEHTSLQSFCSEQVEKVMELWNHDEMFRKQYVEANKSSTIRRLQTLDGRSLGPGEVPPVLPARINRRASTQLPAQVLAATVHPTTPELIEEPKTRAASRKEDPSPTTQVAPVPKKVRAKVPVLSEASVAPFDGSSKDGDEEPKIKDSKTMSVPSNVEPAHDEEELKKKAAEEKERLRLEQKAKAKEAEERKRRQAEKAQERAEYKARKDAEMKGKKKVKKEKKKTLEIGDGENCCSEANVPSNQASDTDANSNGTSHEAEVHSVASKRPSRAVWNVKQLNRGVQPVPPALRNRSKRKMRSWILLGVAILAAITLLVAAAGYISFSGLRPVN